MNVTVTWEVTVTIALLCNPDTPIPSFYNETFREIVAMNKAMHNEEYRCDYLDHGLLPISLQLVIADANRWKFVRYAKNKGVLTELA